MKTMTLEKNPLITRLAAASVALSLLGSGCSTMTPTENALLFGGIAGAVAGTTLALAGVDPGIAMAIAGGTSLAVGAGAFIYSKQQATARQRQIALQNARAAEARLAAPSPINS